MPVRLKTLILSMGLLLPALWSQAQESSVLATGDWYKIGVTSDGVYKIDQPLLEQLGAPSDFDPLYLRVFGNGVGMLPQPNNADRPVDLRENAIAFYGNENNSMEADEYFLIYAKGPHTLSYDGFDWTYQTNRYSDTSYYFLQIDDAPGLRVQQEGTDLPASVSRNYDYHTVVYDPEETNLLNYVNSGGSGREWFGDLLIPSTGLVLSYDFETPHLIDSLTLTFDVIGFSESQTSMDLLLNQAPLGALQINGSSVSTYSPKGRPARRSFESISSGETQNILLDFIRTDGSIYGFINQIMITYRRELVYEEEALLFNNQAVATNTSELTITSAKALRVWDVSDAVLPVQESSEFQTDKVRFASNHDTLRWYVAFDPEDVDMRPLPFGPVGQQNIRALNPKDGLIISAPEFVTQARELAAHHQSHDNLDVAVVTTRQIYNEFSSGMQDVTALRDAVRHYYSKTSDFRYLLLFGDCSFDYKDRIPNNTNYVPVYESINSWDPVLSYSSDDFYGFMEEDEGIWRESSSGDHTLEIGIGRLPVKSRDEAEQMVNKIIGYAQQDAKRGEWKSHLTYVVDDGNVGLNDTWTHMRDAEDFIDLIWDNHPQVIPDKLYIDAFPQEVEGNAESSRTVRSLLQERINEGTFMVNFMGHGSEQRWTEETVLDLSFINQLSNSERLPIFVTATCEFGRYDDPTLIAQNGESGAEKLILKEEGGAIALITTTRPVYAFTNYSVNRAIHFYLMRPLDEGPERGQLPRLGDIIRFTKNFSLSGPVNRNFALLGDPMLRLDYPDLPIELTAINSSPAGAATDTLSALQTVQLEGQVTDLNGAPYSQFNGTLAIKVYDTFSESLTLGQRDAPFPYKVREHLLFNGTVNVIAGEFQAEFIMPKNISYQFEKGSMTFYAYDPQLNMDAVGGYDDFVVGGSADDAADDNSSPEVSLAVNRSNFSTGQKVTKSDTLIATIFDESGINTSGLGLNRNITLQLNDSSYIINSLYQSDLNTFQNGTIRYPLSDLSPGSYTATVNLFDIHNNEATASVDFVITDQPELPLIDITLYPNPARDRFSVQIAHERANETLDIRMDLLSLDGKTVWTQEWVRTDFDGTTQAVTVDLGAGSLQNGVYLCNLHLSSRLDGASTSSSRRVIIIN